MYQQTDAIRQVKEAVDLYALAGTRTELRHWARDEWAGPCPRCGGKDRFHVHTARGRPGDEEPWWKCYRCHPRRGDVIAFVRWLEGCDFAVAVSRLSDMAGPRPDAAGREGPWPVINRAGVDGAKAATAGPPPSATAAEARAMGGVDAGVTSRSQPRLFGPAIARRAVRSPDEPVWQARAQREAAAAARRLWRVEGEPARSYLAGRGLFPLTWRAWDLGFLYAWHPRLRTRRPAIAIPWRRGGKIMAIEYRFIPLPGRQTADVDHGDRFSQKTGGERTIFGQDLLRVEPGGVLIMVEGEFNALSIWQALHDPGPFAVPPAYRIGPVDVVSFGSEAAAAGEALDDMAALATGYDRAVLWADRLPRAAEAAALLRGRRIAARALSSPKGCDANDLLAKGTLADYLGWILR